MKPRIKGEYFTALTGCKFIAWTKYREDGFIEWRRFAKVLRND